jgi:hypothetical protein
MANDLDDSLAEATSLGTVSTTARTVDELISPDTDVDMYAFTVATGQTVDFDIDTSLNGPGGLGSFLRLFNLQGQQLASNNDANAPGENVIGFDAYLRFTFTTGGTYFLGVSNANNTSYNQFTGDGDAAGGQNSTGSYRLIVRALPVDDDDSIAESISLGAVSTNPSVVSDIISPDIDVDIYRFTVAAGQVVDFDIDTSLNGPGGLGSALRLFNAQGQVLAFNDDANAPGENVIGFDAYLRFTFSTAGTYYIGVSNANNIFYNATTGGGDAAGGFNSVGSYQLSVHALPADLDDSLIEARSLGAVTATPILVNSSITPDIDVDIFRFTVAAGQVVNFDIDTPLNGPGGLGSFLRLFNGQGLELAFNNDAAAPGENVVGFDAYLQFTFATAGTYYIGVSNASNTLYNVATGGSDTAGGFDSIGDYQLIVQTAAAITTDPDDSLAESVSLGAISTTPVLASDIISPDVDVDIYSFTVAAGQVVDFDIDTSLNGPGGLGSFLRLFNGQGQELAFNDDDDAPGENIVGFDAYLRFTFTTAGTYYIGVSNVNNTLYNALTGGGDAAGGQNATGNYQLIVQALPIDPDDSLSEAPSLGTVTTTPDVVNDSITPDIDVDLYSFTVAAGQVVDFDIDTAPNGPGGLGSFLRLFNAQGQELAFNDDAAAPGESVIGFDAYLRFTFAAAGTYFIGVSNNNNTLYNPTTGGADAAGGFNSIGSYQLTVQLVSASSVDPDDTLLEANALAALSTTPTTVSASISPDPPSMFQTDVDMYRFTVAAGQVVDFDIDTPLNGSSGLESYLRLFNAQGLQLAFNDDATAPGETFVGFDAYLRFTFAAAGTYFIAVSNANNTQYDPSNGNGDTIVVGAPNATGSYQLIVQLVATDTDDSLIEATSLGAISTAAVTRTDTISPDIDVDIYRFTVTAGQVVDFDIDTAANGPSGLGSFLRLFNAQGQQLAFNNDANAPGENVVGFDAYLRFTFAVAGTYYVGVSNANNTLYDPLTGNGDAAGGPNAIGNYQLIVQALPVDLDDSLSEAPSLGAASATPVTINGSITPDIDVDVYRFTVAAGQVVDFDIDTSLNGPGGVDSFLRLFNAQGQLLTFNNNAAAPGESQVVFDAYLRFTFATAGTYYVGVSNANNMQYDPISGGGDVAGGFNSIGSYQLSMQALPPPAVATLLLTINVSSIPELNGTAVGTVSRSNSALTQALVVALSSSDTTAATVPPSVTIPVNQSSATFTITAVDDDVADGTETVTITASAAGFVAGSQTLQVTDNDGEWHNAAFPTDVTNDGIASPIDALTIINFINAFGAGPVPAGNPPPYYDVNSDNFIGAIDVLMVINYLNAQRSGAGEGEAFHAAAPTFSGGTATASFWPARAVDSPARTAAALSQPLAVAFTQSPLLNAGVPKGVVNRFSQPPPRPDSGRASASPDPLDAIFAELVAELELEAVLNSRQSRRQIERGSGEQTEAT